MTNAQIFMIETQRLAEEGVLKYTGNVFTGVNLAGEEVEIKEVEQICTVKVWNKLGYKIKKGEHAKCKFRIWFRDNGKRKKVEEDDENDGEERKPGFYKALASFFTIDQVELKSNKEKEN